ncbi:hypothetical protein [Actibacterium sp.]|uniref:COG3904 family protein n=1 Tax=Actibacterium sp. TaxID=1872125 RepID=UPI002579510E|nr:hypothetical protein [Actibacterium sp.]
MRTFIIFFAFSGFFAPLSAMDFSTTSWNGHDVVQAEGVIESGDHGKLIKALAATSELPHGYKVVLLDSPGGSVDAALEMSKILDSRPAHTVIPSGASCASACASILFIAGEYRTIETGGRLGQHSCATGGIPDEECNELLAQHAVAHGVSHGSVKAFVTYTAPEDMTWMTREDADCWGITRYPYTRQSGFGRSEPCAIRMIAGSNSFPPAQSAWRVDFFQDGYRAFLRPAADHMRELQLNLHCDEDRPGQLFLSMEIGGPSEIIDNIVQQAILIAHPTLSGNLPFRTLQVDDVYSSVEVGIPKDKTLDFLTKVSDLRLILNVAPDYDTIYAETRLDNSREALLFVANHCVNQ